MLPLYLDCNASSPCDPRVAEAVGEARGELIPAVPEPSDEPESDGARVQGGELSDPEGERDVVMIPGLGVQED